MRLSELKEQAGDGEDTTRHALVGAGRAPPSSSPSVPSGYLP